MDKPTITRATKARLKDYAENLAQFFMYDGFECFHAQTGIPYLKAFNDEHRAFAIAEVQAINQFLNQQK